MPELTRPGIWASLKERGSPDGSKVPSVQRPGPLHSCIWVKPWAQREGTLGLCWPPSPFLTDNRVLWTSAVCLRMGHCHVPLRFGPHKGAASSHLTLTAVPAPHPWLGHASGPLCQAKLLGDNWGHRTWYEGPPARLQSARPLPSRCLRALTCMLAHSVGSGRADLKDTGRALQRTTMEARTLGYCWVSLTFITFNNPTA